MDLRMPRICLGHRNRTTLSRTSFPTRVKLLARIRNSVAFQPMSFWRLWHVIARPRPQRERERENLHWHFFFFLCVCLCVCWFTQVLFSPWFHTKLSNTFLFFFPGNLAGQQTTCICEWWWLSQDMEVDLLTLKSDNIEHSLETGRNAGVVFLYYVLGISFV